MPKAIVAALRVKPDTVLSSIEQICELGGARNALDPSATTILKDNISWHFPFPGANTTPWQLEGTIRALRHAGYERLSCVQNKTVVTNAFKGEDLNNYLPILQQHDVPVLYNFRESDMKWVEYRPKATLRVLHKIFPDGLLLPDYFFGKNVVHLPTVKCHIYTTTTGAMKNAFGGLLNTDRHYTHSWIHETLVDLLAIQREIHSGLFAVMDGTTAGNGPGPRTMIPVVRDVMLASSDQVAIDAVAVVLPQRSHVQRMRRHLEDLVTHRPAPHRRAASQCQFCSPSRRAGPRSGARPRRDACCPDATGPRRARRWRAPAPTAAPRLLAG